MKELEKNLEATGGVPAEAELAAINRFEVGGQAVLGRQ